MANGYDYRRYAILYVDDEERTLKNFRKAFENEFSVVTASSVREALQVIDERGDKVGVVITDQRMPGATGVDLLGKLRQSRPQIVRILATAYADIESAIGAVNSGAIYKYVVKPWDLQELHGTLLRAVEFFSVQRERDLLLREKLSVIQRLVIADRVSSLAALAAGLSHHIRNSMTALNCFLESASPAKLPRDNAEAFSTGAGFREDLWSLARNESAHIIDIVQRVAESVAQPAYSFTAMVELQQLVACSTVPVSGETRSLHESVSVSIAQGLPPLKVDQEMVQRLFRILIERTLRSGHTAAKVTVTVPKTMMVWSTPGVQVLFSGEGPAWSEADVAGLFTAFAPHRDPQDLGLDLLSAFFIAYHHGGDLLVHRDRPHGPGFELHLPFDPEAARRPELRQNLIDRLLTRFELWDSA